MSATRGVAAYAAVPESETGTTRMSGEIHNGAAIRGRADILRALSARCRVYGYTAWSAMAHWQLSAAVVTTTRAGPAASSKLREVAIVRLICPTCQNVFAGMSYRSSRYCAWGCFRYFFGGVLPEPKLGRNFLAAVPSRRSRRILA